MIEDERQEPREEGAPEADGQEAAGAPEGEAPADQSDAPAAEGEAPADESGAPAPEGETPAGEAGSPESEGDAAADDAPAEADAAAPAHETPAAEPAAEADPRAGEHPAPEDSAAEPKRPARGRERRGRPDEAAEQPEVVPGADLEPDLVLDEPARQDDQFETAAAERYAEPTPEAAADEALPTAPEEAPAPAPTAEPAPLTPRELAADARYQATGKRKTAVARVILKPGSGAYTINGRTLEQFFPRHGLQATARQPLAAAGYESRMDVVARLHGGGVSSQAGALRHGVARALVEADPALREELKRRGYLTRDPRAKERKKAGLKKARKRPQFSKR